MMKIYMQSDTHQDGHACLKQSCRQTHMQRAKHSDRHTCEQTNIRTDTHEYKHNNKNACKHAVRQICGWTCMMKINMQTDTHGDCRTCRKLNMLKDTHADKQTYRQFPSIIKPISLSHTPHTKSFVMSIIIYDRIECTQNNLRFRRMFWQMKRLFLREIYCQCSKDTFLHFALVARYNIKRYINNCGWSGPGNILVVSPGGGD